MFVKAIQLFLLLTILSCQNNNTVIVKNDKGVVVESYSILPDSTKNGIYNSFFDTGEKFEEANYINGVLEGSRTIFHKNGHPEMKETYKEGILIDTHYTYYENGQLEISAPYSEGQLNGQLTAYYENGKVKEVVTMEGGNENGPFKEYYENGQIHWQGNYLNGDNEYGLLKEFDESGQLLKKMMCDSLAICRTIWTMKDGDITPKPY